MRLLFSERENLSEFFEQCRDVLDFDIDLLRVFDRSNPATYGEYELSQEQRNTLLAALEAGYYEVPRQAQTEDIADQLDVSPQAISQRLRRGYNNLITNTIGIHESGKDN